MTMQSVFFKENRGSVHVQQTRWAGLCSRTMMQPTSNRDGNEAFPKLITSLELSANYAKGFNGAAADAVKEREVHSNKQTLDHKGNNYTTHDLFTLLSDYEVGVREDAQNGQQTTQVLYDRQGHFEFGFGRPTVCAAKKYPYAEACYRVYSTYGNQIVGRIVLPLNTTTGGDGAMPIYVNAKQYNGIMRRRRKRAQLVASEKKVLESRKPYMHLSRHLHAMRRPRGSGGRFLNAKDSENSKKESKTDPRNKPEEHNKHNNLRLYNSSTGSSQVSEVLLRSTTKSSGGERSYSPNSEVNSHHHVLSFDMNDHLHHHNTPPSFEAFPNNAGLGFNVIAASDGAFVMGNSFLAKSSLSPAFGDN